MGLRSQGNYIINTMGGNLLALLRPKNILEIINRNQIFAENANIF